MQVKLGKLLIDQELLRIRPIDEHAVSRYRQHYRQGVTMPPPIIDENMRVISGNHRVIAMKAEFADDYVIEVVQASFSSEADALKVFAKENISHGIPLSGKSQAAIIQKLVALGEAEEAISELFGLPISAIRRRHNQFILVRGKGKSEMAPSKAGIVPIGATMEKDEYERHWNRDFGHKAYELAEQLTEWIENGRVDMNHDRTAKAMSDLHHALSKMF